MQTASSESFVALFDIIGFRALRSSFGTSGLMQKFERSVLPLVQYSAAGKFKNVMHDDREVSVADFHGSKINYRIFSDTVIFWTHDDSLLSFLEIVRASGQLAASGFGTQSPYRGAIGHGDILSQSEIIVGAGIEDAYVWEQSQAWAGVSLTPKCEEFCTERSYFDLRKQAFTEAAKAQSDERTKEKMLKEAVRLRTYPVPLQQNPKDGPATYSVRDCIVLDWTLNVFEGAAEKSLESSASNHARAIKKNTVEFEAWARSNRAY